jgi:hypothetical protein
MRQAQLDAVVVKQQERKLYILETNPVVVPAFESADAARLASDPDPAEPADAPAELARVLLAPAAVVVEAPSPATAARRGAGAGVATADRLEFVPVDTQSLLKDKSGLKDKARKRPGPERAIPATLSPAEGGVAAGSGSEAWPGRVVSDVSCRINLSLSHPRTRPRPRPRRCGMVSCRPTRARWAACPALLLLPPPPPELTCPRRPHRFAARFESGS